MSDVIFERYAALKEKYPEDVARIVAEEERVQKLLQRQDFAEHPAMKELIALCRKDIVQARVQLSSRRHLKPEEAEAFWMIIESRKWVLEQVAVDFSAELTLIETDLEAQLAA